MLISGHYCNKFGNYSPPFIDFLKSCLTIDPLLRPSCLEQLRSSIFSKMEVPIETMIKPLVPFERQYRKLNQ